MSARRDRIRMARLIVDALLAGLAVSVVACLALGRGAPLLGATTLLVAGGSMEPALPLGAAIVTFPAAPRDIEVGEVVAVRTASDAAVFTHRVIRIVDRGGEPWLETMGDANRAPDPALVPAGAVVGRVALAVPYAGYLLRLLSEPVGVLFVVSLAATLLVAGRMLDGGTAEVRPLPLVARGPG